MGKKESTKSSIIGQVDKHMIVCIVIIDNNEMEYGM